MLEQFSSSVLSVHEIMLLVLSYYPETVLAFCPLTWESYLNHVIAAAYHFVVELYIVFRTYFIVLRQSLLQHTSSNFLIGSQVSHLVSLSHFRSIFVLNKSFNYCCNYFCNFLVL